jgi:adenylate cyclase
MAKEIERKFLVRDITVLEGVTGRKLVQGYLTAVGAARARMANDDAFLTIRGPAPDDVFEYAIPMADALELQALSSSPLTTRVRIAGDEAFFTIKGPPTGISCDEFEYAIPIDDARRLLALCGDLVVEKTRYELPSGDYTFEVDVFEGRHAGLVLAEVELPDADAPVDIPGWVGAEVSGQRAYSNAYMALHGAAAAAQPR